MSLDEAIANYMSAIVKLEMAKEQLVSELKGLGLSDELVDKFIEEVSKKPNAKPTPTKESSNFSVKVEKKRRTFSKPRGKVLDLDEGEVIERDNEFIFKRDGKVVKRKTLPLYDFKHVRVSIDKKGEFILGGTNARGRGHYQSEPLVVAQIRNIIKQMNDGELKPGDLTIYEPFIEYMLPRMRPLAKEAFLNLIKKYKEWVSRHEDGGRVG